MTDGRCTEHAGSWVFYDGECAFCISMIRRFAPLLARLGFQMTPLQTPWVRQLLHLAPNAPPAEMRILLPNGETSGGADAILAIARRTAWALPLVLLAKFPGVKPVLRRAYRAIASRRHCLSGLCSARGFAAGGVTRRGLPSRNPFIQQSMRGSPPRYLGSYMVAWLLMAAMVVALMLYGSRIPAWLFMWALAGAIFLGFKWLMLLNGLRTVPSPSPLSRIAAYLFLWPGMDPRPFLNHAATASTPALSTKCAWVFAGLKTLLGVAVLLLSAHSNSLPSLVRGWLGMIGIVLLFHFGIFDLLSLGLRRRGFPVKPIMRNPLVATSLSEFWARRWNTAFSQLAHTLILLPLKCEFRITAATFAVFVISGLIHDLVISVPAGGGYGLPTAYFLFQGLAVLLERSNLGRRIGLGCGWRGRIFAVLVAALPAFWLFHPLFIRHVILPMLDAIGGLKIL